MRCDGNPSSTGEHSPEVVQRYREYLAEAVALVDEEQAIKDENADYLATAYTTTFEQAEIAAAAIKERLQAWALAAAKCYASKFDLAKAAMADFTRIESEHVDAVQDAIAGVIANWAEQGIDGRAFSPVPGMPNDAAMEYAAKRELPVLKATQAMMERGPRQILTNR